MDRRILAVGLGAIIVVSGILVLFMSQPVAKTEYHFESDLADSDSRTICLEIFDILDGEVSVMFTNDSDLRYSVDIEFYGPMRLNDDFRWVDDDVLVSFKVGTDISAPDYNNVLVKSIEITLGCECTYDIHIRGFNVTTAVIYGTGIRLGTGSFMHQDFDADPGDVSIFMESDVNVTDSIFYVGIEGAMNIYADIRNPSILGGTVDVFTDTLYAQTLGWVQSGYSGNWHFTRTADEEIDVNLSADTIYLNLLTQNG